MAREYDEIPDEVHKLAWNWIEREEPKLQTMVRNYCVHHPELAEEMYHDVVLQRVAEAMMTYKPWMGAKLRTHIFGQLKWYLWKYISDYERDRERFRPVERREIVALRKIKETSPETMVRETNEQVQYVLKSLPPYERAVLILKHLCEMSFDELAGVLELSTGAARKRYQEALDAAKRITE